MSHRVKVLFLHSRRSSSIYSGRTLELSFDILRKHKDDENSNVKTEVHLPPSVFPSSDTDKAILKVLFTICLNDLVHFHASKHETYASEWKCSPLGQHEGGTSS